MADVAVSCFLLELLVLLMLLGSRMQQGQTVSCVGWYCCCNAMVTWMLKHQMAELGLGTKLMMYYTFTNIITPPRHSRSHVIRPSVVLT